MPGAFAIVGVILLILAGFEVRARHFDPGWLGLAFVALAVTWPAITAAAG